MKERYFFSGFALTNVTALFGAISAILFVDGKNLKGAFFAVLSVLLYRWTWSFFKRYNQCIDKEKKGLE